MADYTLTVRDVAHRAGVSPQTLYNYFPELKGRPKRGRRATAARHHATQTGTTPTRA